MRMADFLDCQKCGWLPLTKNINGKWKFDFLVGCGGEMGSAHKSQFPTNTILKSFAKAVECLRNIHFKKDQNTPISLRPFKIIDVTFLDQENFKKLKIKNLFEGDLFVSHNSLNFYLNEVIPDDKYKI